jgi:hypothetical protein
MPLFHTVCLVSDLAGKSFHTPADPIEMGWAGFLGGQRDLPELSHAAVATQQCCPEADVKVVTIGYSCGKLAQESCRTFLRGFSRPGRVSGGQASER